jgi:membrane protein YqaA with SNARE-associated domain
MSWRGAGLLMLLLWVVAVGAGVYGVLLAFPHAGDSSHAAGLAVLGIIAGSIIGSPLAYALGIALNRRRSRDGSWYWTNRHELMDQPVQEFWKYMRGAVILAPCLTAGSLPKWATWALFAGWVVLLLAGAVAVGSWRRRRDQRRRAETNGPVARG